MQLPSFLTGQLWKIATGGAAAVALLLSSLLISTYFTNRDLTRQRDALARQIDDPKTGYVAQLAQSHTNVAQLRTSLEAQTQALDRLSKESKRSKESAQRALDIALAEKHTMEKKLAGFLSTKPQGATLEARIRDIDERAMVEFNQ
jgi:hypothetical protein